MMNQGKASMSGKTNQPGPSSDQATMRVAGPAKGNARQGNKTAGGGITKSTSGKP